MKLSGASLVGFLVAASAVALDYDLGDLNQNESTTSSNSGYSLKVESDDAETLDMKSGIPSGGIFAYEGACPDGSVSLDQSNGRALVGQGGLKDGSGTYRYELADKGGQQRVRLTLQEIPPHSHGLKNEPDGTGGSSSIRAGPHRPVRTWQTDSTGGNQYHENRMPYLALSWCVVK
ncbi:hypothetical protein OTK49_03550 [Vibrio coralliirubri]|uniref:phage tail protein n=1 Tax=Vibrio coralliirubri TaxID=1516159 RepID=UPI002284920F|nr:hypothetical protein [Vibrio coralliirubri]MCY9861593.1 hypothetical protein [Vibrio coralliirubri]